MRKRAIIINWGDDDKTDATATSLLSKTPDCDVWVFNNGEHPYEMTNDGKIRVIDNTRGAILNYEELPKKYAVQFNYDNAGDYMALKNACTVNLLMHMFYEGFLLCASGVEIIRDVTLLFNRDYAFVGHIEEAKYADYCGNTVMYQLARVLPDICFINSKKCLDEQICYLNKNKIAGLNGDNCCYLAGASLLADVKAANLPFAGIEIYDYITQ